MHTGMTQESFQEIVNRGNFRRSIAQLKEALEKDSTNDNIRFELGTLEFFHTLEALGQSWYRFGDRNNLMTDNLPLMRLSVTSNPDPEEVDYTKFRGVFVQVLANLRSCEKTLAEIKSDDVAIEIDLMKVGMDWNGNGRIDEGERLGENLAMVLGLRDERGEREAFAVRFDRADVYWLSGYCHLLSAFAEFFLAYDHEEVWNVYANWVFPRARTSGFDFSIEEINAAFADDDSDFAWYNSIVDAIAAIHSMRLPLREPEALVRSHQHLLQMVALSRQMWEATMQETDDDREWIPNPRQKPPMPSGEITEEMVAGWHHFLNEFEDLLEGRKLVPFWRGTNKARGLNLRKVFHEPQDFDLIFWIQGAAAVPFLQDDIPVSDPATWDRINRIFRGDFIGFAIWIN